MYTTHQAALAAARGRGFSFGVQPSAAAPSSTTGFSFGASSTLESSNVFRSLEAAEPPLAPPAGLVESLVDEEDEEEECFGGRDSPAYSPDSPKYSPASPSYSPADSSAPMDVQPAAAAAAVVPKSIVGSSQAGKLSYGREITEVTRDSGCEYNYELASAPTILCLSITPDLKFQPLGDLAEEAKQLIAEYTKTEGKMLIESLQKIYPSETCLIDLCSEADTVLAQCGHQCLNHMNVSDKLKSCPVCRGPISAFGRADGLVL